MAWQLLVLGANTDRCVRFGRLSTGPTSTREQRSNPYERKIRPARAPFVTGAPIAAEMAAAAAACGSVWRKPQLGNGGETTAPHSDLSTVALRIRPSSRKLRKLDPAHVREVAASITALGFCEPVLIGAAPNFSTERCAMRRRGSWALIASPAFASGT